jgi:hypothetical protein
MGGVRHQHPGIGRVQIAVEVLLTLWRIAIACCSLRSGVHRYRDLQLHGVGRRRRRQNWPSSGRHKRAEDAEECSEWSIRAPAAGATRCHCPVGSEPLHQIPRRGRPTSPAGGRSSSGQGRLKPELANIFLIFFSGSARKWAFSSALAPSCNPPDPSFPKLSTSHGRSYRNIGQSSLAGRLHPLRASSPGVPDATMHATVHMHHLGNSSSTQPRSTSSCTPPFPSATTLL